ncbi:MAG: YopX family protein [Clostridium sp.]|uniref:YopX family protein n=1 Tax=Clostridium sp. TaxID=1506 RepID=UPI002909CD98|nr:YopX family protein [Clostridium sp.]MDU7339330.1 YopX family protein [Clostridium sp.]
MREILFRGKRLDNGKWVQGYIFKMWECAYILWGTTNGIPNMIEVDPETVGQFTGLMNKNETKGFEGDIVSSGSSIGAIVFNCGKFAIRWIVNKDFWSDTIFVHLPSCEIIGNRWDNPELLEGAS